MKRRPINILAGIVLALSASFVGCVEQVPNEVPLPLFDVCAVHADDTICEYAADSLAVARCVKGACVPYGCDICPRLPCNRNVCDDGICKQVAEDDGTMCTAFPAPLSPSGVVGTCSAGACVGAVQCSSHSDCPSIECIPTICGANGTCEGIATVPGYACQTETGEPGACFNFTCNPR